MTVTIIKDTEGDGIALGGVDVRTFKEGEIHTLNPAYEQQLIDAGIAEQGGETEDAVEKSADHEETPFELANKVSHAPQAVDTAAVAARVVNDGLTHDSESGTTPGSTNEEGPEVRHADDLLNKDAESK